MLDFRNLNTTYLIAEIGINHNGDIQIAKRLIDAVFACGWNCAKFQKRDPDVCVPEEQKNIPKDTPWGEMTYLEYKKRIEFSRDQYDLIDTYCRQKPLSWTASVWDHGSLQFVLTYDVPFIKIPSAQVTNKTLLEETARSGKPVIMSTGMSTLEEIDTSVDLLLKHTDNFLLMHTNSSYPAPKNELNLRIITTLKERYKCPVGYSGHEYGVEASVIAAALGACVIERHITLDHDMWGTDQKSSLEIVGMDRLRRRIVDIPIFLGSDKKDITTSEMPVRKKLVGSDKEID